MKQHVFLTNKVPFGRCKVQTHVSNSHAWNRPRPNKACAKIYKREATYLATDLQAYCYSQFIMVNRRVKRLPYQRNTSQLCGFTLATDGCLMMLSLPFLILECRPKFPVPKVTFFRLIAVEWKQFSNLTTVPA